MNERIRNAARELIPAVGYGDTAGAPVETKHATEIAERHGYITELLPIQSSEYFPGDYDAGTTTDDTSLTAAVVEAIVQTDGFSLDSQR